MSLGETRRGPTRPVRLHRRLLQPTTDPLCHRLQNARTSREAGGVTPVSIKSGDHQTGQAHIGYRPSKKSIQRAVEKVHVLTERSCTWQETTTLVGKVNRTLRG